MQLTAVRGDVGELSARRSLRSQITYLQADLSDLICQAFPEKLDLTPLAGRGARLLSLGELETVRDQLLAQSASARQQLRRIQQSQAEAEEQLQLMLLDPQAFRGQVVTLRSLGKPGCGAYRSLPRLGVIGRMMGWWQVKLSSGCP